MSERVANHYYFYCTPVRRCDKLLGERRMNIARHIVRFYGLQVYRSLQNVPESRCIHYHDRRGVFAM